VQKSFSGTILRTGSFNTDVNSRAGSAAGFRVRGAREERSLADGSLSRVLVTGGAGLIGWRVVRALLDQAHEVTTAAGMEAKGNLVPRLMRAASDARSVQVYGDGTSRRDLVRVEHVPAKPGEMPPVNIDISAARSLAHQPRYDLKAGIATVWPEFSETAK
jgi:NAD(P)-dependent dehydrogenase (short-subunit alcohol dehydrogenase family)